MKIMLCAALALSLAATAESQTLDDVRVNVHLYRLAVNGGEKRVLGLEAAPEGASAGAFSSVGCAMFRLQAVSDKLEDGEFDPEATTGWRVQVTPTRIVNRAVTFRVRWVRGVDNGRPSTTVGGDAELTLVVGEARTIDRVAVPSNGRTGDGSPCRFSEAILRISADYRSEAYDRRLIAADLWLMERLPNGRERSFPLAVRGLPNRPIEFHFDSIAEGARALEVFGELVARLGADGLEVTLRTFSRWGPTPFDWRDTLSTSVFQLQPSVIQVRTDETVEIGLPSLDSPAGPFANRAYSIRMRARQIR
jgi:hypothetical protein